MTKKHFEAIAAIIAHRVPWTDPAVEPYALADIENIATDLADYFESVNPRFDREKFLTAAGITAKL